MPLGRVNCADQCNGPTCSDAHEHLKQETRMPSQSLNRTMPHSRNQLEEGVNHKEKIFYLAVQL